MKTIFALLTLLSLSTFAASSTPTAAAPWPFPEKPRLSKSGFMGAEIANCLADDANAIAYPKHTYNELSPYKIESIELMSLMDTQEAQMGAKLNITTTTNLKSNIVFFSRLYSTQGSVTTTIYRAPTNGHHLDEAYFKLDITEEGKSGKLSVTLITNEKKSVTTTYTCRVNQ